MDDSVARVMLGRELLLRRARGYAPLPVHLKEPVRPTLALGAHLKNTVAFGVGNEIFISQHIGDLETREAYAAFSRVAADLPALFDLSPESIACDLHPDYLSTKHAQTIGKPVVPVQHHYAHIAACMAENELEGPLLGVAWDGTGLGTDGTIWGGEFLLIGETSFDRLAHLRQFRLPGGDASIRQPRRTALGLLFEVFGERTFQLSKLSSLRNFSSRELATVEQMLQKSVNAPVTSSAGRLFDAVASIIGLRQEVTFEGQAAMELEFAIEPNIIESYPFEVRDGLPWVVDWEPMLHQILKDVQRGLVSGVIAAKFHNALSELIVSVARKAGEGRVILSGGCFQNRYLTERTVRRLEQDGFRPYWHQRVPPNDGGIALGQVMAALRATRSPVAEEEVCIS
jgi:hydrogenase maturation protein HypF